jgi:ribosome biogenesis GTPase
LIQEILPRRSKIARRAAGRRDDEQVLAANVDIAMIVCGLDGDFNVRRLERYLAIAREGGVEPVVVLNKADLCASMEAACEQVRTAARSSIVVGVSALTGAGCELLRPMLGPGVTGVLLGSSGAGKSSLLNRLAGAEVHTTRAVRESDSRGRHTTTDRELVALPSGGALIDTPGLREIQLWASAESVELVFDDISELAAHCRFGDCTHTSEPGCAVAGAVSADRLASYHKLKREASRISGALERKREWKAIHRGMRQFRRLRGR